MSAEHSMGGPLEGIKVLDLSRQMAGPYGTMMLSDMGADVIKVEGLPVGDPSRITGTEFSADESWLYLMWNGGKRSVAVDLHHPEGIEIVRRLARDADVFVENYRPGVAESMGLGYETLNRINPGLVYCSVSAFGPEGPLAPYPGMDIIVQAMSGIMSVTGEPDGPPELVGAPIGDFTGAMCCMQGVLLGLFARERTGRGQKIDVSMLLGLLWSLGTRLASFWSTGENPKRFGSAHSVVVPYQVFQTADGYAMAGVFGDAGGLWERFCRALGRPELAEDSRYLRNVDRVARRQDLVDEIQVLFRQRTTAMWEERFHEEGVLFSSVNTFSDIFSHPHVVQTGIVQKNYHPTVGEVPQLKPLIQLSETHERIRGPAPLLGQHTIEVLVEAGWTNEEVERLHNAGVIGTVEVDGPAVAKSREEGQGEAPSK